MKFCSPQKIAVKYCVTNSQILKNRAKKWLKFSNLAVLTFFTSIWAKTKNVFGLIVLKVIHSSVPESRTVIWKSSEV